MTAGPDVYVPARRRVLPDPLVNQRRAHSLGVAVPALRRRGNQCLETRKPGSGIAEHHLYDGNMRGVLTGLASRRLGEVVEARLAEEPVIVLNGPRTVGKSTLLSAVWQCKGP
jgi:hypothetical protein